MVHESCHNKQVSYKHQAAVTWVRQTKTNVTHIDNTIISYTLQWPFLCKYGVNSDEALQEW